MSGHHVLRAGKRKKEHSKDHIRALSLWQETMKLGNSTEKYLGGCSCYEEGGQRKLLEYAGLLAEI